ncbi:glutathione S-transferase family protein [Histidinibacterium aquaticum]|uniref:Glutathione S-transferase family protein n=1 Tax=Histidinibacterium aquaticum TaxID=2613962 RepID=A0A5J5GH41_9RHOB|nr:glutathione S-transferase family protein [Histidinibacterium aquaticum]KAA9007048.1 glutathione S-transferase family protein [Histidinibacterium aquaticum]
MGQLVDGKWKVEGLEKLAEGGSFKRATSKFRNWITKDGSPGPSGEGGFPAESGRYHLYVSYACPWAHRALVMRKLKDLEPHIGLSVVHPEMLDDGWTFGDDWPGATGDDVYGFPFARDLYIKADPQVTGRVTVPILWDKERETIVSNESSEVIRMLNEAFNEITGNTDDYWPQELREEMEPVNARIYDTLNNGVYKSGFATTQQAYEEAVNPLFETMDWLEERLSTRRYLMGERITEADWRLFTTLVRFDPVYHGHFKCNRHRLIDYPNLWAYTRELYQWPTPDGGRVADTVNFDHIKHHYYYSHESINPHRVVPVGPDIDYDTPHGREGLKAAA